MNKKITKKLNEYYQREHRMTFKQRIEQIKNIEINKALENIAAREEVLEKMKKEEKNG